VLGSDGCTSEDVQDGEDGEDDAPMTGTTGSPACDPRPAYPELYSSCTGTAACGSSDHICAYQVGMDPAMDPAYCTSYCTFDVECSAVGMCTAVPICLTPTGGGTGVCALDCADDMQCPEGMQCLEDMDNGGIRYLCF
jgi:hypothetical protein